MRPNNYWTGLITLGGEPLKPHSPYKGAGWTAVLVKRKRDSPVVYRGREVVIRARSWFTAQRALDLIDACHQLLIGDTPGFRIHPIAWNDDEPNWMSAEEREQLHKPMMSMGDFPIACAMAAKASRYRRFIYAAAQYRFSLATYCVHYMDMEPFRSPHLPVSRSPNDHVMFAHAIVAAYAAIENLQLELRASSKNPSRINGNWNPAVLAELEARLAAAHIDINEPLLWVMRGAKRKIGKKRAVSALRPAEWAAGPVRDADLQITEAIAYASWLRSKVAAHRAGELTPVLSPYDVTNVQHLARRLFLESLGYWKSR